MAAPAVETGRRHLEDTSIFHEVKPAVRDNEGNVLIYELRRSSRQGDSVTPKPQYFVEDDRIYTPGDIGKAYRDWRDAGTPPPPAIARAEDIQYFPRTNAEIEAHNAAVLRRREEAKAAPKPAESPQRGLIGNLRLAGASLFTGLGR